MSGARTSGSVDYVFDGSFDGLLTAVSLALGEPEARLVEAADHRPDLFAAVVHVQTDGARAAAVRRRFVALAGRDEIVTLRFVHASEHPQRLRLLLSYVRRTLQAGRAVGSDIEDPDVLAIRRIRDQVDREIARLLGFLRFRQVTRRTYYAPVSPDSNVVGFLGPHFAARFPDQPMIIHDIRRDIAFWVRPGARPACGVADLSGMPRELRSRLGVDCRPEIEELWRVYFVRIANPERLNRPLQRKLLPARYWRTLVEEPAGTAGCPTGRRAPAILPPGSSHPAGPTIR
jgi:probable DNA metabolism protein